MKVVRFLVTLLLVVGALNWGLIGFFQYDLVSDLFGGMMSGMSRTIFALVGLAGLYKIFCLCKCCKSGSCGSGGCNCNCHNNGCRKDHR